MRDVGERARDVPRRKRRGEPSNPLGFVCDPIAKPLENLLLDLERARFGVLDLVGEVVELVGRESLAAGHGLLSSPGRRRFGDVRLRDLDVPAEDVVVADANRDARLFLELAFERDDELGAVLLERAMLVESCIETLANDAAVARVR